VGGGVQLGPFSMAATDWPTVACPGDYDDGESDEMKIGRGNRSTQRKLAPAPLCPPQIKAAGYYETSNECMRGRPSWSLHRDLQWSITITITLVLTYQTIQGHTKEDRKLNTDHWETLKFQLMLNLPLSISYCSDVPKFLAVLDSKCSY
jgi:hypothetical protein